MQKRILVVDDDEWVLFVLLHTLTSLGSEYDVVTAKTGAEAWAKAQEERFDLLITDLGMPAPDGVELTEMIRAQSPDTVVVWITAYGGPAIRPEYRRLDVYRCLEKPVEVAQIRQVARQALDSAQKPRAIAAAAS
jgi:CheY-like chemotaxis protein